MTCCGPEPGSSIDAARGGGRRGPGLWLPRAQLVDDPDESQRHGRGRFHLRLYAAESDDESTIVHRAEMELTARFACAGVTGEHCPLTCTCADSQPCDMGEARKEGGAGQPCL